VGEAVSNPTAVADLIDRWADVWFGFVMGLAFSNIMAWLFLRGGK
jgi:hypothetical protein